MISLFRRKKVRNPYRDANGRFTTKDKAVFVNGKPNGNNNKKPEQKPKQKPEKKEETETKTKEGVFSKLKIRGLFGRAPKPITEPISLENVRGLIWYREAEPL